MEENEKKVEVKIIDCKSYEEWKRWNDFADAIDELGDQMTCPDDIDLDE